MGSLILLGMTAGVFILLVMTEGLYALAQLQQAGIKSLAERWPGAGCIHTGGCVQLKDQVPVEAGGDEGWEVSSAQPGSALPKMTSSLFPSRVLGNSLGQEGGQAAIHGWCVHVAIAGREEQGGLGLLKEDVLAGCLECLLHLLAGVGVLQLHTTAQRESSWNPRPAYPWQG